MKKSEMTVTLPVCIENVDCVTNCWIYNRLAIIKTSPYYRDWIASHYDLHVNKNLNFDFGETRVSSPSYHDAILERRPLQLFQFHEDDIIEKIKAEIIAGYYIVMYVREEVGEVYYHEVLFYGFDDVSESLQAIGLTERSFQAVLYSYSYIREMLPDVKKYFMEYPEVVVDLFLRFQYPVTAFRLNRSYSPENCPFEAYCKLKEELDGACHCVQYGTAFGEYKKTELVYRGISCLYAFYQILDMEINGDKFPEDFTGLTKAAKKLQEHQRMIWHSMKYVVEKWRLAMSDQSSDCISGYRQCYTVIKKWLAMVLKYEHVEDKKLLKRIMDDIPEIFERERKLLDEFVNQCIVWDAFNENYI